MRLFKNVLILMVMSLSMGIAQGSVQGLEQSKQVASSMKGTVKSEIVEKASGVKLSVDNQVVEAKQAVMLNKESTKSGFAEQASVIKIKASEVPKKMTKVNINTADINVLQTLKGIGESKAKAIIDYRTQHGKIKNINELAKIPGVGEATLEKLKGFIRF